MSKPRQFWCDRSGTLDSGKVLVLEAHQAKPNCWAQDHERSFHLVEFSAYQSAIEELKAAKETLSYYRWYLEELPWRGDVDIQTEVARKAIERIDQFLKEQE